MEISSKKTKSMSNNANGIQREIKTKCRKLGIDTSFKYLGGVVSDDGSKAEILTRIAQQPQLLQNCSQSGDITSYLLDQR